MDWQCSTNIQTWHNKDSPLMYTCGGGERVSPETERNMAKHNREWTRNHGMAWGEAERRAQDR